MSGALIVGGEPVHISVPVDNYLDFPDLRLTNEDMRDRVKAGDKRPWIRSATVHNTKNIEPTIVPGSGPHLNIAEKVTQWWSRDGRHAGAHLVIDWDGVVSQLCDVLWHAAYHASQLNEVSIGIEVFQDSKGRIYEVQMRSLAALLVDLCRLFGIQRQTPPVDVRRTLAGMMPPANGRGMVGVFGHCHCSTQKGNDPGKAVFAWLVRRGVLYEMDFDRGEDRAFWRSEQHKLGLDTDGIPGPATCTALARAGYADGIWMPAEREATC